MAAVPSNVFIGRFGLPGEEARFVRDELEQLARDLDTGYSVQFQGHADRERAGADAGVIETITLFITGHTLDAAVGAAIGLLFERFARAQPERPYEVHRWRETTSPQEAVSFAAWIVYSRYKDYYDVRIDGPAVASADDLELISEAEDREHSTWSIVLRDKHGWHYRVKLGAVSCIPTTAYIERTRIGTNPDAS